MTETRRQSGWILALAWSAAMVCALAIDRPVAQWVHDAVPIDKRVHLTHQIIEIVKLPGWFPFTLCVAAALEFFHRRRWAVALSLSGVAVGGSYSIIKWIAGRHRPVVGIAPWSFHPFPKGLSGIWREQALCFPSGHASLSFSSAMCLALLLPRWRWAFFAIAAVTATERILENAHYVSDVVAGAGLGMLLGSIITHRLMAYPPPAPPGGGQVHSSSRAKDPQSAAEIPARVS